MASNGRKDMPVSGRCVLLWDRRSNSEDHPPRALIEAISRKGMMLRLCDSTYQAMAELMIALQEQAESKRRLPLVLLVIEPKRIANLERLLRSASLYAPRTVFWRYERDAEPRLSVLRWDPQPANGSKENGHVARHSKSGAETALRLSGSEPDHPTETAGSDAKPRLTPQFPLDPSGDELEGEERANSDQSQGVPTLTEEELAMLWADEPWQENEGPEGEKRSE